MMAVAVIAAGLAGVVVVWGRLHMANGRLSGRELSGVPSLRVMIGRAKRAGAKIYIDAGDYVVRFPGVKTLRVNLRRKDSTPELVKAVWMAEVDSLPRNVCRVCRRLWVECICKGV